MRETMGSGRRRSRRPGKMLEVVGIRLPKVVLSDEDKQVFADWNAAKAAKDFAQADQKRVILIERGLM